MTNKNHFKPAFTPGPYVLVRTEDGVDDYFEIRARSDNRYIGSVQFWDDHSEATRRALANATLFMMATEMLAITKSLVRANRKTPPSVHTVNFGELERQAIKIIALAEGRVRA